MAILKLKPCIKEIIWGGQKLFKWNKDGKGENIAETWELSMNPNGLCTLEDGRTLQEVLTKEMVGSKSDKFAFFPMLIKLIDTNDNLSVQVHPSDDYALVHENSLGKTEMWHILDHEPGAGIYIGFNKDLTPEELSERVKNNTLMEVMNFVEVNNGDTFFIESGTVHAIGKGITLIEIQQNSNLTYRIYDYDRRDKFGNPRELHVEKALKVTNLHKYEHREFKLPQLGKCEYFSVYRYKVAEKSEIIANNDSFISITFVEGKGFVNEIPFEKGDTFFIPNGEKCSLKGEGTYVLSTVE